MAGSAAVAHYQNSEAAASRRSLASRWRREQHAIADHPCLEPGGHRGHDATSLPCILNSYGIFLWIALSLCRHGYRDDGVAKSLSPAGCSP
jgi:hypothetical protein